jgi:hypothetical protein
MAAQSPYPLGTTQTQFSRWGIWTLAKVSQHLVPIGNGDMPPNIAQYTPAPQFPIPRTAIICRLKQPNFIGLDDHLAFIRKSGVVH